eukprot:scaffold111510_cov54-Attheya_sp.AAC.2
MASTGDTNIRNKDLLALRAYIGAGDSNENLAKGTILVDLTYSNLKQRHVEIRFDLHDTVDTLRAKIHQKSGTPAAFQHLQIKINGVTRYELAPGQDDARMLGYFGLEQGSLLEVHCIDLDPHSGSSGGQYEDTSLVQKYVMSDEDYQNRKGTLRDWGNQQKAKDPTFNLAKHARQHRELMDAQRQVKLGLPLPAGFQFDSTGKVVRDEPDQPIPSAKNTAADDQDVPGLDTVDGLQVGDRCEVQPGGRRGVIAFVGEVPEFSAGYWVGVIFDEPVGKTDGTAKNGKRYFESPANHGGFLRGKNVTAGDFPERDIFDDDSDSDDEL